MKAAFSKLWPIIVLVMFLGSVSFAASPSPALLKAKKEAEAKGYIFYPDHDEIMAKAKTEGKLRAIVNMRTPNIKASGAAFRKQYPFIDLQLEEITGTAANQRFFLEVKSGMAKDWDVIHISTDVRSELVPHLLKVDIQGMAEQKVLQIPPPMIDPTNHSVVAFSSRFQITAYNKNLVPANQLPKVWEDLLRPEFKGKKFAVDIRPTEVAALVPAWGLEKTLDFARKVAAQQPIWVRGSIGTMTAMLAGEVPMMVGPNFHNMKEIQAKDRIGVLQYVILEPVPLRFGNQQAILATSQHPYAALLWLEWMASPEAQKITDEREPLASSVYVRGGTVEQELRGKKLSVVGWEFERHMEEWQTQVVGAYGFPKAESRK